MPTFSVHKGKRINLTVTVYDNLDAANPANNVINNSATLSFNCPTGAVSAGVLLSAPTNPDGSRNFFVQGDNVTATSANLRVSNSANSTFADVLMGVAAPPAVPAMVIGASASAEYDPA